MQAPINRVKQAIDAFNAGKMVILTDDPDRENEGDLIIPAELITADIMNFMIRHGSGIVCLSMTEGLLQKLDLPLMIPPDENKSRRGTPFTVSIDARDGITTGVSAADRVETVMTAIRDHAHPDDLVKPGHMFPLKAHSDGVYARQGHTEGSIDLARIAGFKPAAVLCEIMNPDGTMTRGSELLAFAEANKFHILTIDDILTYRLLSENLIEEETSSQIQLEKYGKFSLTIARDKISGKEHAMLTKPSVDPGLPTLVRIHSSCTTGDIFASNRCDCHKQLHYSLKKISEQGGTLIYLSQEGRGIGLFNKIKAYALQETGLDTVEANEHLGLPIDARKYFIASNMLRNHGIDSVRVLTNNPAKISDLIKYGIPHVEREPMPVFSNQYNQRYLRTKKEKLQHLFNDDLIDNIGDFCNEL